MKLLSEILILVFLLTACSSTQERVERRQNRMQNCVEEFLAKKTTSKDAYEICRHIYGTAKLRNESLENNITEEGMEEYGNN